MTLSEFKAWFGGYTEDMDGPPSAKQWKRIKSRVKDIDGEKVTYPVFIDRYWARRRYELYPNDPTEVWNVEYTSTSAMTALGQADASLDIEAA